MTGRRPLLRDPAQHLDAGEHVEAAVEPAAVRHRVHVTADQHGVGRSRPRSVNHWFPAASRSTSSGRSASDSASHARPSRPRLRPRDALLAVLVPGQLAQLPQLGDGACWVERHGASLTPWHPDRRALEHAPQRGDGAGRAARVASCVPALRCSRPARSWCSPCSGASGRATLGSGNALDRTWPFPVNDITMPHLHESCGALRARAGRTGRGSSTSCWHAALFTAKEALLGLRRSAPCSGSRSRCCSSSRAGSSAA